MVDDTRARMADHGASCATMRRLVETALHLCVHGERAPGGDETWSRWARDAETELRRLDDTGDTDG